MYEMFLGPLEQSKPWNTNGIDGVFKFLRKFWRLAVDEEGQLKLNQDEPVKAELKVLHQTLRKVEDDIEKLSLNTSVSTFMIAVNELNALKCTKQAILEPLTIALSPFAPHMAAELWEKMGHSDSVLDQPYPQWKEEYLKEDEIEYPVAINGKMRFKMAFAADASTQHIEENVRGAEQLSKWLEGKAIKKVIVVPGRMINVVL
jgi:leucyl-tRNA synthetase